MRMAPSGARPITPVSRCLHCGDPWEAHTDDYGCIVGPTTFTMGVTRELLDYAGQYANDHMLGFANESNDVVAIKVKHALCEHYGLTEQMLRVRADPMRGSGRVSLDISTTMVKAVSERMLEAMGLRVTCRG